MKEGVQPRVHTLNSLEYMHQKKKEIRNQNKNKAYQVLKTLSSSNAPVNPHNQHCNESAIF
jgi:hypothetical protein